MTELEPGTLWLQDKFFTTQTIQTTSSTNNFMSFIEFLTNNIA